jgi:predicted DNA binding CopG/RHH family protein
MSRRGRPITGNAPKTKRIYIRLTPKEKVKVTRKAKKAGMSVAEYVRSWVL